MKIKLGVIFGGNSVEHEISIVSAVQAMENIDADKYDIVPIYISKEGDWYTSPMFRDIDVFRDFESLKRYAKRVVLTRENNTFALKKVNGLFNRTIDTIDVAFEVVHGKGVEDGSLSGYLEMVGVPYVGPSMLGASIGQDKVIQKMVLKNSGINVVKHEWFYDFEYLEKKDEIIKKVEKLGYPVIVKPAHLGSSIGIHVANDKKTLEKHIDEAIKFDSKILVEEVIENLVEVNASVVGNIENTEVSELEEVTTDNKFLTFEDKYTGGKKGTKGTMSKSSSSRKIPAEVSDKVVKKIEEQAVNTFKTLELSGITRIDFLVNKKTEEVYVNEPNTIPGSLSFYLWTPKGKSYSSLLDEAINLAIKQYKKNSKKVSTFESNYLKNFNGSKGLKGKLK